MTFRALRAVLPAVFGCAALLPATAGATDLSAWSPAGLMSVPRYGAVAARLADGDALVIGGASDNDAVRATTERFDPLTGHWSPAAPLAEAREFATAVTLPDGRVLVAGGRQSAFADLASAELFDPATGTWSPTGRMSNARAFHRAAVLADGRVLVVGGEGVDDAGFGAEIWDPSTNAWTATGPVRHIRQDPSIARLPDGSVLVAGGWDGDYQASAEVYDPVADSWTETAPMREPRMDAGAAVLPDGRVLVAGGHRFVAGHPETSRTSEIYDPTSGAWTRTGDLVVPRGEGAQMVVLEDGRPAVTGGFWWTVVHPGSGSQPPTWSDSRYEPTAEIFAPASGMWALAPQLLVGRADHVAVPLADGTLLVAGGFGAGTLAERLGAPPPPPPAATPTPPAVPDRGLVSFVRLRHGLVRADRSGRFTVRVRCKAGPCYDELTLRARRGGHRRLAHLQFGVRADTRVTLPLRLSRRERRRLAGRTIPVTLRLVSQRVVISAKLRAARRAHRR